MNDWLAVLFCLLPVALVGATVWGLRRLSAIGFQTAIEMDGITCLKANDGSVIFRRSSGYIWLRILIFGVLELALLAFIVLVVAVGNWTLSLLVGLLIGLALFNDVHSLRQPYIYVSANSRILEHGTQRILFSSISNIYAIPRPPQTQSSLGKLIDTVGGIIMGGPVYDDKYDKTYIDIVVALDNGDVIELGIVSGLDENSVRSRATTITKLVAEVTGAAIRESDGNIESIESIRKRMPSLQPQVTHKQGRIMILIGVILLVLSMLIIIILRR